MKAAQAAVAALALLLGGALGVRAWRGTPVTGEAASVSPKSSGPSSAPVPAYGDLGGSAAGSLALRWIEVLAKAQEKTRLSAPEEELLRSQERELNQELKNRLSQDPARWIDVLEVVSKEDPRIGRKVIAGLKDGVNDAAEAGLIRALKDGAHREIRISSATLIAGRTSSESLWALVTSAQEDPDFGVRYKSLSELAARQGRAASPTESTTIDELFRTRAQVDPDPGVRQFALRITGQSTKDLTTTAPSEGPRPRSR
jgi:hypothetical protein